MERKLLGSRELDSLNFCLEMSCTFSVIVFNVLFVEANIYTDNLNNLSKLFRSRGNCENGLRMFKN